MQDIIDRLPHEVVRQLLKGLVAALAEANNVDPNEVFYSLVRELFPNNVMVINSPAQAVAAMEAIKAGRDPKAAAAEVATQEAIAKASKT